MVAHYGHSLLLFTSIMLVVDTSLDIFDNVRLVLRTTDSLECSFMDRLSPKTLHPHTLC